MVVLDDRVRESPKKAETRARFHCDFLKRKATPRRLYLKHTPFRNVVLIIWLSCSVKSGDNGKFALRRMLYRLPH